MWHLPGPETVTTRALLDLVAGEVGHPVGVRSVPKLAVRALGLVNPMLRELAEMAYEFDEPFVLDTSKYESTFGAAGTPLAAAVAETVAWYRTRPGTSMTTKSEAANAMTTPLITVTAEPAAINGAGPTAAWSQAGAPRRRVHPGRLRRLLAGARRAWPSAAPQETS